MGCEIVCEVPRPEAVAAIFADRDARFSRFRPGSELNAVNASLVGPVRLSAPFAQLLGIALAAADSTSGLVTPAVGAAVLAAGYDRDFEELPADRAASAVPARVPPRGLLLSGRVLVRLAPVLLDLNGVVKSATVDDALADAGGGWVSAGGDLATTVPVTVGLPGGQIITLVRGGLATSSVARRTWLRGGEICHHLIDPATGAPSRSPWRDVTAVAGSCIAADVAAKAALLHGEAGPRWLQRRGLAGRFVDHGGGVTVNERWRRAAAVDVQLEAAA
jgi:thiamine biosynthesis lipoprotein